MECLFLNLIFLYFTHTVVRGFFRKINEKPQMIGYNRNGRDPFYF